MKPFKILIAAIVFGFHFFVAAQAGAVDVIRNGSFDNNLDEWMINPELPSAWNPLSGGLVHLNPDILDFEDLILYQNLNVSGIGGVTVNLSMNLLKTYETDGNTVAVWLQFVDTGGNVQQVEIFNPDDSSISISALPPETTTPTPVSAQYTFPAEARKLVKLAIVKDDYGDFYADDISLTAEGVTVGAIPLISGLSAAKGAYGSTLTVTGVKFGAVQGDHDVVSIGGSSDGVSVTSWSDTSITATINDPVKSGRVYVTTDYVESNIDFSFEVTSPNYTVNLKSDDITVVKGQTAEYVIAVDFHNEFSTTSGISFSIVP